MHVESNPDEATAASELQKPLWNRSAAAYADAFQGCVTQAIEPLLDAANVERESRVLDVATGPGIVAAAALERGAAVKGVDFAENMIAVARSRCPKIEFDVADAADLPFDDHTFDAVVMGFALFLLPEPGKALHEAYRVLVGGGRVACTVWDWPVPGFDLFYAAMERYVPEEPVLGGDPPLFGVSDTEVLKTVLADAGFANPTIESVPIVWELASPDQLFDALATLRDFSQLPDDALRSFRSEVRDAARQYQRGGSYHVPFPALLLAGTKP